MHTAVKEEHSLRRSSGDGTTRRIRQYSNGHKRRRRRHNTHSHRHRKLDVPKIEKCSSSSSYRRKNDHRDKESSHYRKVDTSRRKKSSHHHRRHRKKSSHRRHKKEESRISDLLKIDYPISTPLVRSNSNDNIGIRSFKKVQNIERRKSVAFSRSMVDKPQSDRGIMRKPLTPLESLSSLKAFNVNTKIRTFTVKVGVAYIRGCYSRKEGDCALLRLNDFKLVLDKNKKEYSSSEDDDDEEAEEEKESPVDEIPSILEGIEVIYYEAWSLFPDGSVDKESMVVAEKAKEVHEANTGIPMVRVKDVYEKLFLDGAVHKRRVIFGLVACLEPYVKDEDICSTVRKVHKMVARWFIALGVSSRRPMSPMGCMLTGSGCRFIDDVKDMKEELNESRHRTMLAFTSMERMSNQIETVGELAKQHATQNQELMLINKNLSNRLLEMTDENTRLKETVNQLQEEMNSLTDDYRTAVATVKKLTSK